VLFSLSSRPTRLRRGSLGDSFRLAHNTVHLPKPPPDGRGSVTVALISQGLLSRERKRAGAFPKTFKRPNGCARFVHEKVGGIADEGQQSRTPLRRGSCVRR
jgi:hypothetical protein